MSKKHHDNEVHIQGSNIQLTISNHEEKKLDDDDIFQQSFCVIESQLANRVGKCIEDWTKKRVIRVMLAKHRDQRKVEAIVEITSSINKAHSTSRPLFNFHIEYKANEDADALCCDIQQLQYHFQGFLKHNEFPRMKNPFEKFYLKYLSASDGEVYVYRKREIADSLERVLYIPSTLVQVLKAPTQLEQKHILLDRVEHHDLLRYGNIYLQNIQTFAKCLSKENFYLDKSKFCFPKWAEDRMHQLKDEVHTCTLDKIDDAKEDCDSCHEYAVFNLLHWWYNNFFINENKEKDSTNQLVLPDLSIRELPSQQGRMKSLVIVGRRESGKTKFFESLCGFDDKRVVHFKNRFTQQECLKLEQEPWIILIDDFTFNNKDDLQTIKSLIAGEKTVILGKWLVHNYNGHLPCVILTNNEKDFLKFLNDPQFNTQCRFIRLKHVFLGPPHTKNRWHSDSLLTNGVHNVL